MNWFGVPCIGVPCLHWLAECHEVIALAAGRPVFVVCRRGIDSATATAHLSALSGDRLLSVRNVDGGLLRWRSKVDPSFPVY
eukprot:SAG11_NODE_361_length_10183_cov_4.077053_6_plen_82_part_00